jgi:succinate dehydrogenase / fumarate reductase membrane anchor subunit
MTTPLGRVRGLGSAKGGTRSYVLKQASGLALGLLTPYMIGWDLPIRA